MNNKRRFYILDAYSAYSESGFSESVICEREIRFKFRLAHADILPQQKLVIWYHSYTRDQASWNIKVYFLSTNEHVTSQWENTLNN